VRRGITTLLDVVVVEQKSRLSRVLESSLSHIHNSYRHELLISLSAQFWGFVVLFFIIRLVLSVTTTYVSVHSK
jgi:hypothetical protein